MLSGFVFLPSTEQAVHVSVCKGVVAGKRRFRLWLVTVEVWRPLMGIQGCTSSLIGVLLVPF